jgi:hypothetical protein
MAIGTDGIVLMRGVIPILILGIHHMAVITGGWFVAQVGWRVRHPGENAKGGQKSQNSNKEREMLLHPIPSVINIMDIYQYLYPRSIVQKITWESQ